MPEKKSRRGWLEEGGAFVFDGRPFPPAAADDDEAPGEKEDVGEGAPMENFPPRGDFLRDKAVSLRLAPRPREAAKEE